MKTVVLKGSQYTYDGPEEEVWGCGHAVKHRGNPMTRYYFMDDMREFNSGVWAQANLKEVGKIKLNTFPIVTSTPYPEFPTARGFDRATALDFFGFTYYTSTVCYMLADAIREGYEKIVIHRFHEHEWGRDYIQQKAAMDFWIGYAAGAGIEVEITPNSSLAIPYFWMLDEYGYAPAGWTQEDYTEADDAAQILMSAVKDIGKLIDHRVDKRPTNLIPMFEGRFNGNQTN